MKKLSRNRASSFFGGGMMLVDVIVELSAKAIDKTFTYHVPPSLSSQIEIGKRVLVPFGRQQLEGFILNIHQEEEHDYVVKDLLQVMDEHAVLNEELIALGKYMQKKTLSSLVSCYQTMLPKALKAQKKTKISKKYETYYQLQDPTYQGNELQMKIVQRLKEQPEVSRKELSRISPSSLQTLEKKGIIKRIEREVYRLKSKKIEQETLVSLTEEQKSVIEKVLEKKDRFAPFLLHGVTGSGKTEVYMRLISEVLKEGKEAIVLVPEISLTPQMVDRFRSRFQDQVAILHSRLSVGEKYDEWRKIERKEVSIVIGARSAIFAPFQNLGMIIIDEEHSTTYKQENMPKYHAIDVALYRAKYHHIPIVLGSATPSLESYTRAKLHVYELLEMKHRVNHALPEVQFVSMKEEMRMKHPVISRALEQEIQTRLEKREQVILLLNKRGYSRVVTCKRCGETDMCPNCDIPLIYHKEKGEMQCHYCNYHKPVWKTCPHCHGTSFTTYGMGTEKLEEYVKKRFPTARILRMDADTTSRKGSHERMVEAFSKQEYDLLIGTQMIAKGLDFPQVTLVGVLESDNSLNIPDFRSAERTFQLLSQVAGRAGRNEKPGKVILQGFQLDHYSIVYASRHDYIGFYQEEMKIRKKLKYPPFRNLSCIQLKGKDDQYLMKEANKIRNYLQKNSDLQILGPSFSSMPKVNQIYTVQLILKYQKSPMLISQLKFLQEQYATGKKCKLEVDLTPIRI